MVNIFLIYYFRLATSMVQNSFSVAQMQIYYEVIGVKVVNYIDDIVCAGNMSQAYAGHKKLLQILHELGLDINETKNIPPSTKWCVWGLKLTQ